MPEPIVIPSSIKAPEKIPEPIVIPSSIKAPEKMPEPIVIPSSIKAPEKMPEPIVIPSSINISATNLDKITDIDNYYRNISSYKKEKEVSNAGIYSPKNYEDDNNQLYKDQILSMIRLSDNLGRSIPMYNEPQKQLYNSEQTSSSKNTINEEDLQRAMELVGSQGQKQINLKIGDITLPTDDKKLLESASIHSRIC